jgi:hypothetical protein
MKFPEDNSDFEDPKEPEITEELDFIDDDKYDSTWE